MVRALLIRGMLAGVVAGLLVFAFGKVFGEPRVDRAIAFETALDAAKSAQERAAQDHAAKEHDHGAAGGHSHGAQEEAANEEPELVSRPVQAGLGLLTGVMVYAAAFGGLFGLVFAAADRRLVHIGPRADSALLAAAAFVSVYVIPNLKYPANPPSVGDPDTISVRTALYFIMLAASVAAIIGSAILRKRLAPRFGGWNAALIATGLYIVAVALVGALLPGVNEVPEGFPASLLWEFRIASLGMQAILWATIGLVFGVLAEKVMLEHDAGRAPFSSGGLGALRKA
jgi:predicted cobalt transporter CbtA